MLLWLCGILSLSLSSGFLAVFFRLLVCLSVCLSGWMNDCEITAVLKKLHSLFLGMVHGTYCIRWASIKSFAPNFVQWWKINSRRRYMGQKNPTWPSSWISSCSYTLDDLLHRMWYLRWQIYWLKICSNDGMFKLATRNKFNMAAATVLNFVFWGILVTNEVFLL